MIRTRSAARPPPTTAPAGIHVIPFPMACGAQPTPQSAEPCDLPLGACLSSGAPLALARPDFSDLRLPVCPEAP